MSHGALGYVGYGVESVEGTLVAPTIYLPVSSLSFEDSNDLILPDQIRHSRDRSIAMAAPYVVSGTMEMELVPVGIGYLLKSALCASVETTSLGSGAYQHVFTPGNTSPTFSVEGSAADILVMRYGGIRVNTLDIRAAFGEIVTASFGLEGTTREKQGSAQTPTYADVNPLHFSGVQVKFGGSVVTTVKDLNFTVGNNLDRIGTLRRSRAWKRTVMGFRDIGFSCTVDFDSTTEMDRFFASDTTTHAVEVEFTGGLIAGANYHSLKIEIPVARWNRNSLPLGADLLEQSIEAVITKGAGAVTTVTLITTDQSFT